MANYLLLYLRFQFNIKFLILVYFNYYLLSCWLRLLVLLVYFKTLAITVHDTLLGNHKKLYSSSSYSIVNIILFLLLEVLLF